MNISEGKELKARIERLEAQVAELMAQLGQKSREIPAPYVANGQVKELSQAIGVVSDVLRQQESKTLSLKGKHA